MSWMTVAGIGCLLVSLFAWGYVIGGCVQYYKQGGTQDYKRAAMSALREYDELCSIAYTVSAPPQKERGTLHRLPVAVVERSPLTLINGDAS